MEESVTQVEPEKNEDKNKHEKKVFAIIVSVLFLLIILIGGYIARILSTPNEKSETEAKKETIGIIRIKEAIKSHKDYEEITELRKKYESLMTEIIALSEPVEIKLPDSNKELFKEAANQKLSQTIVDKIAALEEKRRAAVEKYANDTKDTYEKQRAEIDERYLNAIADLRMKLDNADILHLTDAKINELSEQLEALQHERGDAQEALKGQREQEIYAYGEKVINDMSGEIATVDAEAQKLVSESMLKESEVANRNMKLLEESFGADRILKIKEKEAELDTLKGEMLAKEDKILSDISSIAAKYATQKELEIVLTNTGVNIKSLLPAEFQTEQVEPYSRIVTLNSIDITDDIIKDLLIER